LPTQNRGRTRVSSARRIPVKGIAPHLWFDHEAEEAPAFYVSVFKDSRLGQVSHYTEAAAQVSGMPTGSTMSVSFELAGHPYIALNGGPVFRLSEAVSFVVNCETQEEVDYFWDRLLEGGDESAQQCGWLKDRFGLSWQVVPTRLAELLASPDPAAIERVMAALLPMEKLDIAGLEAAFARRG
jgi:predicted 3-demethylubiquinone-9 3-methyltransferase (glyoxalase superfamily)